MDGDEQVQESACVPPGFRFHPTEEELVGYYLARKVASRKIDLDIIQDLDLYRIEPWDLQLLLQARPSSSSSSSDWYFFSYRDRKYPSGTRTNRATAAGFWKATGRDKPVLSTRSSAAASAVIGMRKTLVFYRGRAPNGTKTDWIMHEYRLVADHHHHHQAAAQAEQDHAGWVVCRAFHKPTTTLQLQLHQRLPAACSFFPATPLTTTHLQQQQQEEGHGGYYDQYALLAPAADAGGGGLLYSSSSSPQQSLLYSSGLEEEDEAKMSLSNLQQQTDAFAAADLQGAIDWNFLDTLLHESAAASTSLLH